MNRKLLALAFAFLLNFINVYADSGKTQIDHPSKNERSLAAAGLVFPNLAAKPYGTPDYDPGATSSAAITYTSSNTAVATIVAGKIHIVTTGTANITATDGTTTIGHTLTVTKATLTVTANNAAKVYGSANPVLSVTYSGFVNGDTQTALSTQASAGTTATVSSVTGSYPITAAGAVSGRYSFVYVTGQLSVTPALLTVTANNTGKPTGAVNPALTATYTGFVNGDTQTAVTTAATLSTTATTTSAAGSYPITANGAAATNYIFTYVAGILTVKSLTFPSPVSKAYGTADYDIGATSGGPVTYTSASPAVATIVSGKIHIVGTGTSNITATDGVSSITHTLVINKAPVVVTPNAATQIYGSAPPAFAASYSGLASGETSAVFTTQPAFTTNATTASVTGTYTIAASGAAAKNYTFTYVAGKLTVVPAAITVTANSNTKATEAANPTLTASYAGFVNGDTQSVITTLPTLSTTATTASSAGNYPITASGAIATNYAFTYVAGTLSVKSLVFPSLVAKVYGAIDFDAGATGGAPISYTSSNTAVATILNGKVHTVNTGTANISATDGVTTISHTLTITKATLTVTPAAASRIYGSANPAFTANYSGFVNTDGPASLSTQPTVTTGATAASAAGTYALTAAGAVSGKYTFIYASGMLTIGPATITVAVNNAGKGIGAVNPDFSATYSGFVNSDTQTAITTFPTFSTTATQSSSAGSYPITAGGALAANYVFTYIPGTLTVKSLTFPSPAAKLYGAADFDPGATSGGPVTYTSATSTVATIVNGKIHLVGVGTSNITATDGTTSITHTLVVNKGLVTVTPVNTTKVYGAANPALSASYTGLASGETNMVFTTQPSVTTPATAASATGTYPITASGAAAKNYTFSYTQGALTVTPATLTITANSLTKAAGAVNPTLTAMYAGFVNGDTESVLTAQPNLTTTAITASPAGSYPITASAAGASNYIFTYLPGTLTVKSLVFPSLTAKLYGTADYDPGATGGAPITYSSANTAVATVQQNKIHILNTGTANISATDGVTTATHTLTVTATNLTVTANDNSKTFGDANPAFTLSYSGFVNGDGPANLTTQPAASASATAASPVGAYTITPSGGVSGKYKFIYSAGTLTVNPATITATVNNACKGTNAPNPAFTAAYTGFVNGETAAVLTSQPTFTTNPANASATGAYAITASGAVAPNYIFTYLPGTLTVSPLVFNSPAARAYGAADFDPGAASGGPVTYTSATPAVATILNGKVHILRSGQTNIIATDGGTTIGHTLTVTKAALSITANNATKVTGDPNPSLSATYTGFVNGETAAALTTQPVITTTATVSSPAGTYPITVSGAASGNYAFTYVSGILTVNASGIPVPGISYPGPQTFTAGTAISPLTPTNTGGALLQYAQVTTLTGGSDAGYTDGSLASAKFTGANGGVFDAAGNMYITDGVNYVIRKITPAGIVSTFVGSGIAGSADGSGSSASFGQLGGITIDSSGNLFVTDLGNNSIRQITPSGVVSTLAGGSQGGADGTGTAASFNEPLGITVDPSNNLYVSDALNNKIRKITQAGVVTTFAGTGVAGSTGGNAATATFSFPDGITYSKAGNIFISEAGGQNIRKITPDGNVFLIAGSSQQGYADGVGTNASFDLPYAVAVDGFENVYVADGLNNRIRKITPASIVTTIAGNNTQGYDDGIGTAATFSTPGGLTLDAAGNLLVFEHTDIRKLHLSSYSISPALPGGLKIDSLSGIISGTPTSATPAVNYTVAANNISGSGNATLNITVNAAVNLIPALSYDGPQRYQIGIQISPLTPTNNGAPVVGGIFGQVSTFAGNGTAGALDGTGTAASFNAPFGTVVDAAGIVYVGDIENRVVRKITPDGTVSTFAGSGNQGSTDGIGTAASFVGPAGLAIDPSGNVYVADPGGEKIRKITPAGVVSTFAGNGNTGKNDGPATSATFNGPIGLAFDNVGNLYVADQNNYAVRKITTDGTVSTLAGTGSKGYNNAQGNAAAFGYVQGVAVGTNGNVYVADLGNSMLRVIDPAGNVTTLAGAAVPTPGFADGTGSAARFNGITDIVFSDQNTMLVTDYVNNAIRKVTTAGVVTTYAGSGTSGSADGIGSAATFHYPAGISIANNGNIYVADRNGNKIRKITNAAYAISPALPAGLTFDGTTGTISGTPTVVSAATNYNVSCGNASGVNSTVVNIGVVKGAAPAISYPSAQTYTAGTAINPVTAVNSGGAVPATIYGQIIASYGNGSANAVDGPANSASFFNPTGVTLDANSNIYVADVNNNEIRMISPAGNVSTFAGNTNAGNSNGLGATASFHAPVALTTDATGNMYIGDAANNLVRKITTQGAVSTYAGNGVGGFVNGAAQTAEFSTPGSVVVDASGNLYVADVDNYAIRKISADGTAVSTLVGSGSKGSADGTGVAASFAFIQGLTIGKDGNIYVADAGNNLIRMVTPAGVVTTIAGNAAPGFSDGTGTGASLNYPSGLAFDSAGNIIVCDRNNSAIRKISPTGAVTTILNTGLSYPLGAVFDPVGNLIIADYNNNEIKRLSLTGYTITPTLPAGLTFDGTTGTISGTPTATTTVQTYTVDAYNAFGSSTATFTLTVGSAANNSNMQANLKSYEDSPALVTSGPPVVSAALSPNGDGKNDYLRIENIEQYPDNKLTLIDRNGVKIYEMLGYDNANRVFDGHSGISGALQKKGTYFYLLAYKDKGEIRHKTGYFIIK